MKCVYADVGSGELHVYFSEPLSEQYQSVAMQGPYNEGDKIQAARINQLKHPNTRELLKAFLSVTGVKQLSVQPYEIDLYFSQAWELQEIVNSLTAATRQVFGPDTSFTAKKS